jgi:MerR family redox-sensitive transcriptional activator SoxR
MPTKQEIRAKMTIGAVARAAGVKTSAIRYYESVGILPPPPRHNGVRVYDDVTIAQLQLLRFYRASGIPIRRLALLFPEDDEIRRQHHRQAILRRIAEIDRLIDEAHSTRAQLEALLECRCGGDMRKCVIAPKSNPP